MCGGVLMLKAVFLVGRRHSLRPEGVSISCFLKFVIPVKLAFDEVNANVGIN
jgi:hypothetical protein